MGMVTALTTPMMSVNWSWTKRMPLSWAAAIFSAPSTSSRAMTTDPASLRGWLPDGRAGSSCAGRTSPARRTGCGQDTVRGRTGEGCGGPYRLVILHKSKRKREREPQLGVGQPPAGRHLDPADPIGDRVAVDAERVGGLGEAW